MISPNAIEREIAVKLGHTAEQWLSRDYGWRKGENKGWKKATPMKRTQIRFLKLILTTGFPDFNSFFIHWLHSHYQLLDDFPHINDKRGGGNRPVVCPSEACSIEELKWDGLALEHRILDENYFVSSQKFKGRRIITTSGVLFLRETQRTQRNNLLRNRGQKYISNITLFSYLYIKWVGGEEETKNFFGS